MTGDDCEMLAQDLLEERYESVGHALVASVEMIKNLDGSFRLAQAAVGAYGTSYEKAKYRLMMLVSLFLPDDLRFVELGHSENDE